MMVSGLLTLLVSAATSAVCLHTATAGTQFPTPEPLTVFVECEGHGCDDEFFRMEITFATHVRERQDARVHILITSQPTADNGSEATLAFIGQKDFAGVDERFVYVTGPTTTDDQARQGLANAIKRGLVRYANHTPVGDEIKVLYAPSPSGSVTQPDRWNRWTFGSSLNGSANGESLVSSMSIGASLSANRTTEQWKSDTSAHARYGEAAFKVAEERDITSIQRSFGASTLLVYGISEHWSVGGRLGAMSSTFLNEALTVRTGPAVEYNVFPYAESTSRMLTVEYSIGANLFDYNEETIFGTMSETLFDHRVLASLRLTQPWGSVGIGVEGSHYLQDVRQHRVIAVATVDWNLMKGLSLATFANLERVRDQRFLPARGASEDEILLRRRQLATSYAYAVSLGITYRFGSRFANAVNRRFSGSVGGMNLMQ